MTEQIQKGVELLTEFIDEVTSVTQLLGEKMVETNDVLEQTVIKANINVQDIASVERRVEFMIANVEKRIDKIVRKVAELLDVRELDIDF
tara:strand:- start:4134 stop:4403 length:270 start_codon:yes stop_codon:yes gene_type:complete